MLAKYFNKNNMLYIGSVEAHSCGLECAMTENVKLPRKLSEEQEPPPPRRASHAAVIDNLDRWANSPGLQPPKPSEERAG